MHVAFSAASSMVDCFLSTQWFEGMLERTIEGLSADVININEALQQNLYHRIDLQILVAK